MLVVTVHLEVLRQLPDMIGEESYLNLGGTRISGVRAIFAGDFLDPLLVQPYLAGAYRSFLSSLAPIIAEQGGC